jgi:hypothetical protein
LKLTGAIVLGSLAARTFLTFDRNLVEYFYTEFSAEYIFIASTVNIFLIIIESTVFSFHFPKILKSNSRSEIKLYADKSKKQLLLVGFIFLFALNIGYLLFQKTGIKADYFLNNGFIIFGSFTILLLAFSYIPNYILYKNRKDPLIAKINIIVLIICSLFFFLIKDFGVYSINITLLVAAIQMLILKTYFLKKI